VFLFVTSVVCVSNIFELCNDGQPSLAGPALKRFHLQGGIRPQYTRDVSDAQEKVVCGRWSVVSKEQASSIALLSFLTDH
jgi:hypothetical protein